MARDLSGTGQDLQMGSDAAIDDPTIHSVLMWIQWDDSAVNEAILTKYGGTGGWYMITATDSTLIFGHGWSGALSVFWIGNTTISGGGSVQIAATYNGSSTANNAALWVNNAAQSITETAGPPSGTIQSDASANLQSGDGASLGLADFDGRVQNIVYSTTTLDAEMVNRHYWYGTPGGAVLVRHPLLTTKTNNEGTATANITLTGSPAMASLPRTERMYCATMGCGR